MKLRQVRALALAAGAALLSANAAHAQVITTASGSGADAHVQLGSPNSNFGTNGSVVIKNTGGDTDSFNRKGYFRFDLTPVTVPVTSASLKFLLTANDGGGGDTTPQDFSYHVYGLNDGSTAGGGFLGENWAENTITWNNAPANVVSGTGARHDIQTGTGTTNGGQAAFLGSFSLTANVGTTVQALNGGAGSRLVNFLNADTNHSATIIITRWSFTNTNGASEGSANSAFAAKELGASTAPSLVLNQLVTGPHVTGVVTDSTWRVRSSSPSAGWNTSTAYDDSDTAGWEDAFNGAGTEIWKTSTTSGSAPNQTWYRHTFIIDGPVTSANGKFYFDDNGQVYLNGHLIVDDPGGGATTVDVTIDPSFFVEGENLIAVHGVDTILPHCAIKEELNISIAPEPGSLGVVSLMAVGLLARRRRRPRWF